MENFGEEQIPRKEVPFSHMLLGVTSELFLVSNSPYLMEVNPVPSVLFSWSWDSFLNSIGGVIAAKPRVEASSALAVWVWQVI